MLMGRLYANEERELPMADQAWGWERHESKKTEQERHEKLGSGQDGRHLEHLKRKEVEQSECESILGQPTSKMEAPVHND
jgi:hypothetical protein